MEDLILNLKPALITPPRHLQIAFAVTVNESPIEGKGLFAQHAISARESLLRMDPDQFSTKKRHPWNAKNADILPHFINHSCDPNAQLDYLAAERVVILRASRAIRIGEEITIDYALVELGGTLLPCFCKSLICRGSFPVNR